MTHLPDSRRPKSRAPWSERLRSAAPYAALGVALAAFAVPAGAADPPVETVRPAFSHPLPNLPGEVLTGLLVTYPPGGRSPEHRHAGSVVAYVLTGAIRSQNSATGPARVYRAGESFFEPPGSVHLVGENASATEPATLLAVFVAPEGATLTERH